MIPEDILANFQGDMEFKNGKLFSISDSKGLVSGNRHVTFLLEHLETKLKKLNGSHLYSEKDRSVGEIFAHIGSLKVGQQHKLLQDILKMLLLEKIKGVKYRKMIFIVDDIKEEYLKGKSFIAESIKQFGIEIKKIDLPDKELEKIVNA